MDKPRTLKQTRLNFILLVRVVYLTRQNPWHLEEHDIVDLQSLEKRKAVFAPEHPILGDPGAACLFEGQKSSSALRIN